MNPATLRRFQLNWCSMTGVWPFGAQVARTDGSRLTSDSSSNTSQSPLLRAPFLALASVPLPVRERSLQQLGLDPRERGIVQPARWPGMRRGRECLAPAALPSLKPTRRARVRNIQLTRDLRSREPSLEQLNGTQPPSLLCRTIALAQTVTTRLRCKNCLSHAASQRQMRTRTSNLPLRHPKLFKRIAAGLPRNHVAGRCDGRRGRRLREPPTVRVSRFASHSLRSAGLRRCHASSPARGARPARGHSPRCGLTTPTATVGWCGCPRERGVGRPE